MIVNQFLLPVQHNDKQVLGQHGEPGEVVGQLNRQHRRPPRPPHALHLHRRPARDADFRGQI